MLQVHHTPLGNIQEPAQHPLPHNWIDLARNAGQVPDNFGVVDPGKLYRSAVVWPHQVLYLREEFGIRHILTLIDGDWLAGFYREERVTIHKFPFLQRRALKFEKVKDIVDVINSLDQPSLVMCLKGRTRTGMVCAGYDIINGKGSRFGSMIESLKYGNLNVASYMEIAKYHR